MKKSTTVKQEQWDMYGLIHALHWITVGRQWFSQVIKNGKVLDWMDLDCDIYATESQASEGHDEMVEKWKDM